MKECQECEMESSIWPNISVQAITTYVLYAGVGGGAITFCLFLLIYIIYAKLGYSKAVHFHSQSKKGIIILL